MQQSPRKFTSDTLLARLIKESIKCPVHKGKDIDVKHKKVYIYHFAN